MHAATVDEGVCMLEFGERKELESEIRFLKKFYHADFEEADHPHLALLAFQLQEYFAGSRKSFDVPLVFPGTPFQSKVWKALLKIPYGATRSYLQQAQALGDVTAIRAVAGANGKNRIAIVVPCHRVIGTNGKLTGYGGGMERKKWLLDFEKKISIRDRASGTFQPELF